MAHEAAMGMTFLHNAEILHRDLKSPNLLVKNDMTVKVIPPALPGQHRMHLEHQVIGAKPDAALGQNTALPPASVFLGIGNLFT